MPIPALPTAVNVTALSRRGRCSVMLDEHDPVMRMQILVVDDEPDSVQLMAYNLTKPVELQTLLATVQEVVKRHRELFARADN